MSDGPAEGANAPSGWEHLKGEGFIDHVGPLFVRPLSNGHNAFAFRAEPKHANLIGVVHGGMLMTLADRALGVAAWKEAGGRPSVTVQFDMQFLSSVKMGDWVEIAPHVTRSSRSLIFMRGDLMVGDRVAAAANGLWKILEK